MTSRDRVTAMALAGGLFVLYNANGREIPSYDSQPTKYAARELLLRGTLSLNHVVGKTPELGQRSGFVETRNGRYRSAYSPVPAIIAAAIAWPFWTLGLIDIRAPLAPALIAAVASSLLVSVAVASLYLATRRLVSARQALLLAIGVGAGTGLWSTASQTLWQHETAIFGLSLATYGLLSGKEAHSWLRATVVGLGVGLAVGSRLQLAPAGLLLLACVVVVSGAGRGLLAAMSAAVIVLPVLNANYAWFGHVLGAAPMLEALHGTVHATSGTFRLQADGFIGLLVSPNRGLLIFSPIVLVAALGVPAALRSGARSPLPWLLGAAIAQFVVYASYSVWWAGHTYGPRYLLDILPLLVPFAALGMAHLKGLVRVAGASLALAWSIAIATIGAFHHPNGAWNSQPLNVDTRHERLWDWSDSQVRRCLTAGPSPQNFALFSRAAVRVPTP